MPLQLEVSNSLEILADKLLQKVNNQSQDVFTPITIVTQTEGINLWLREYIAKHTGIAANIRFITPNDIVFKIYQILGGTYAETISRECLIWLLYKALGEEDFKNHFPEQYSYFEVPHHERDQKRMGMATKVADLLDQYQIYRQQVVSQWNKKAKNPTYIPEDWQEFLWKKIKENTPKDIQDKTLVKDYIDDEISSPDNQKILRKALPHIYLFGLSIFTNYHLDILKTVAPWIDIHFFLLNPATQIYWMDDSSDKQVAKWRSHNNKNQDNFIVGNPLLTNWGKVLQNTFRLLFRSEGLFNHYNDERVAKPQQDSLLHIVQANIFHNNTEDFIVPTIDQLKDETISIHTCYTIAEEVEALYQYLVHLVDYKRVSLSARDISVMVSDIDKYEPYIRAVFDNAPYKFRYKIADVSVANGDSVYSALRLLLELNAQEFTSEKVLQLLESSYIRKRFNIQDIDQVRSFVKESNIRFGIDGNKEDETYIVSWQYGIQRLMYGVCMSGEILTENKGEVFYPMDIVEGHGSALVIKFSHFIEMLMASLKRRKTNRTPVEWVAYVKWLLENLIYFVEDQLEEDVYELNEQLSQYGELSNISLDEVPFEVFRVHFLSTIDSSKRSSLFINDGITFCSLIPMRSVPFKVIALLGMTSQDFPRKEKPLSFSLLQQTYQLGDRNIKDNDKHLFLETVISAKEYLYISYLGHSVKDNTVLPPSVLVEELIDYIQFISEEDEKVVDKAIITHHPMHNYSNKYNSGDPKLYRYADQTESELNFFSDTEKKLSETIKKEISISSLISFFKDAPKVFFNSVLGVYYEDEDVLLPETEIFTTTNWDDTVLKNKLLKISPENYEEWRNKLKLTGKIPLKNVGDAYLQQLEELVSPIYNYIHKDLSPTRENKISLEIAFDNEIVLTGEITDICEKSIVSVCFSSSVKKYILETYIKAMAGIIVDAIDKIIFITVDKENERKEHTIELSDISKQEAFSFLQNLLNIYQEGMKVPYPFSSDVYSSIDAGKVQKLENNSLEDLLEQKVNNRTSYTGSLYTQKSLDQGIWKGQKAVDIFQQLYEMIFSKIQKAAPSLLEKG